MKRPLILALTTSLTLAPAYAGPSSRHASHSLGHSTAAASHGSAAAGTAVTTITAVPIIAFGSAIAVSGVALQKVGKGAVGAGVDLSRIGQDQTPVVPQILPNGKPTLN